MDNRDVDKCAAPASQDEEACPDPGCLWEDDWGACVPERMANTPEVTERHWGEELSPEAEAYMAKVDQYEKNERLNIGKSVENWWERKSFVAEEDDNPQYSDGLPPEWLRLVRSDGQWLSAFQKYLANVFTGAGEGMLQDSHDWTERLAEMQSAVESETCRSSVKRLAPYQAVSERLAITAKLDGSRGFLAYHSVGSGKTVTSAVCVDAFLGGDDRGDWDLFFITTQDNLAQSMEMMQEIPGVSWRERWGALKALSPIERGQRVLGELGLKFSDGGNTDKKTRASYFAQRYDDFATSINAASVRQRMRKAKRSLQAYGGESGNSYFASGDDRRPIIRGGTPRVDEDGHYRPLQGCVIMMDEIQNILTPNGRDQTELYNSLREEIMREPDVKVILLTATPGDTPAQMCAVLNLLVRPPRYLHEGTGMFPSMCDDGGGYAAQHPQHFLRVEDYLNPLTGKLLEGFSARLQQNIEQKSILVSFAHANENRGVFAPEVCQSRNPVTGRCAAHVVEYGGEESIELPADEQTHVHVHAPLSPEHAREVTLTAKGSKRAAAKKELQHKHYTFGGHRINPQTLSTKWDPSRAGGCDATTTDSKGATQTVRMPVCDSDGKGLSEPQFLNATRKLSTIRWTTGGGRHYTPPPNLRSLADVHRNVGSKIAAMLAVVKKFPTHKHVVICSKFAGDTTKAYKKELGYALHLAMGALSESVMGFKYHPLVQVKEQQDRVSWTVCGREACLARQKYHFGLYLTQMPLGMQAKVKRLFNDTKKNVGTQNPYMNVLITNRIEGLSLKTTSFVHLLDAPVSTKNYYQAIGRAIRFCSHGGMEDRRVRVYEYFATVPTPPAAKFQACSAAEAAIDDAMQRLRQGYSREEQRGIAFHVDRPTADGTPVDSLNIVTGALTPRVPDGYRHFSGFVGDLAGLNGKRRVLRGMLPVGEIRRSPKLRKVADRVFGSRIRQFHALPQLNALFHAVGGNVDTTAISRNFEMCSGVADLRNQLAEAEASYRLGQESKTYETLAKRAGLSTSKQVQCADTNNDTAHEKRVREHMLRTAEQNTATSASTALGSLFTDQKAMLHAPSPNNNSTTEAAQDADLQSHALLHEVEQFKQNSGALSGLKKAVSGMYHELKRGGGGSPIMCKVYDVTTSQGKAQCSSNADCEADHKCKKGTCTQKGGIDFSTDTMLTELAGVRFRTTRKFVLAIMAAAVDCLLMFDFHTQHPGAMYGNLPGCTN